MEETTIMNEYEYGYSDNNLPYHSYIIPTLLEMLSEVKKETKEKVRVLDLGCGNGSISNAIASQGYEVVGVEDSAS
ncbi:MAG TPA: hypothetical protein V6C58_08085 [Allocoleopsis sp.]